MSGLLIIIEDCKHEPINGIPPKEKNMTIPQGIIYKIDELLHHLSWDAEVSRSRDILQAIYEETPYSPRELLRIIESRRLAKKALADMMLQRIVDKHNNRL